jgi:membrane associated rhomboid family serine protease
LEHNNVEPSPKDGAQSQGKWRLLGLLVLTVTLLCWATAGGLTNAIAFNGVSPIWLPVAAIAGFSGEISLVIGLSLLGFQQLSKRFESLKALSAKLRSPTMP